MGVLYIEGKGGSVDYIQARRLFIKASESNNPTAMYNLGHIYNYGLGVQKDYVQAAIWYRKASDLGSMSARNSLALFYSKGLGNLPVDKGKALELLRVSACQGYAVAQNNLAILYYDGVDKLPRNHLKSYAWFSVAFYNGFEKAGDSQRMVMDKLKGQEVGEAKNLSMQYIKKYHANPDEDGKDKECKLR